MKLACVMAGRGRPGYGMAVLIAAIGLAVALSATSGVAQEATFEQQVPEAIELELRDDPEVASGRVAVVEGTTNAVGRRYRLGKLSVLQPVMASVLARDAQTDLRLTLLKPGRESRAPSGSTRGEGSVTLFTRTEGGLDFLVEGPDGSTPFALLVWVSDEVTPPLADVVITPTQYRSESTGGTAEGSASTPLQGLAPGNSGLSPATMVLLAFVAGGGLVGLIMVLKRRRHG